MMSLYVLKIFKISGEQYISGSQDYRGVNVVVWGQDPSSSHVLAHNTLVDANRLCINCYVNLTL